MLFYSYVFLKNTNNVTKTTLPNSPKSHIQTYSHKFCLFIFLVVLVLHKLLQF